MPNRDETGGAANKGAYIGVDTPTEAGYDAFYAEPNEFLSNYPFAEPYVLAYETCPSMDVDSGLYLPTSSAIDQFQVAQWYEAASKDFPWAMGGSTTIEIDGETKHAFTECFYADQNTGGIYVYNGNYPPVENPSEPVYKGIARKVKKIYVGVNGTARKVKKAYIGVGGVARLCFGDGIEADPVLGNNDPATIQAVAQSGQAPNYWAVGDTVPITLNGTVGALTFSNETYCAFIIGFDHNSTIEGKNSIHFQFGKTNDGTDIAFVDAGYNEYYDDDPNARFVMNTNTNPGGWEGSYMRNTICPAFLAALPQEWQNVIVACTKYSDNYGRGNNTASYVTATQDKIWLLAECEVFGDDYGYSGSGYSNDAEKNYQKQYDYYRNGNSRKKYKHNATGTTCFWWLRSVRVGVSGNFCRVSTGGSSTAGGRANWSIGFAPGFMVG